MYLRFDRLRLSMQLTIVLAVLAASVLVAGAVIVRSIAQAQVLSEGRSIADMTEHIGKWASQYDAVHVKTGASVSKRAVGGFLERAVYARSERDRAVLTGIHVAPEKEFMEATRGIEEYYSKNGSIIQREVSEVAKASRAKAQFKITAASVLNAGNAPDEFEREALRTIESDYARRVASRPVGNVPGEAAPAAEYWRVERGQMRYARAIVAVESCLRCHGARQVAPKFLLSNADFNGGGGFGYEVGKPAGIISVKIRVPDAREVLATAFTPAAWVALAGVFAMGLLVVGFVVGRVILPLNRLRRHAEALSNSTVSDNFDVPAFRVPQGSSNELHGLAVAIGELSESVRILFRKVREARR